MISNRISNLSCSKREFDSESHVYNSALQEAGYKEEIKFEEVPQQQNKKKRSRNRKVIWFNPPYSDSVKTDIGSKFLCIPICADVFGLDFFLVKSCIPYHIHPPL